MKKNLGRRVGRRCRGSDGDMVIEHATPASAEHGCSRAQLLAVGALASGLAVLLAVLHSLHTPSLPGATFPPMPGLHTLLSPPPPSPSPSPSPLALLPLPSNGTVITRLAHGSCAHQDKDQRFWRALLARQPQVEERARVTG